MQFISGLLIYYLLYNYTDDAVDAAGGATRKTVEGGVSRGKEAYNWSVGLFGSDTPGVDIEKAAKDVNDSSDDLGLLKEAVNDAANEGAAPQGESSTSTEETEPNSNQ